MQHAASHPSSCVDLVCASLPLQSSVGPQPESTVPNPGSMTFGTAQRLPKHGKDGVPGPGMQQLVHAQHGASTQHHPPVQQHIIWHMRPQHAPVLLAPVGHYRVPPALGDQKESKRASSAHAVFGTATRGDAVPKVGTGVRSWWTHVLEQAHLQLCLYRTLQPRAALWSPAGPLTRTSVALLLRAPQPQGAPLGAYQVPGALGRQVVSTKESAPGIKIGSSLRALDYEVSGRVVQSLSQQTCCVVRVLTVTHVCGCCPCPPQVMRAKNLPGAGQYNTYRAVGKQPLSNKKTLPAHSFGKSTRDASKKSEWTAGSRRCISPVHTMPCCEAAQPSASLDAGLTPPPCCSVVACSIHLQGARKASVWHVQPRAWHSQAPQQLRPAEALHQVNQPNMGLRHEQGECRSLLSRTVGAAHLHMLSLPVAAARQQAHSVRPLTLRAASNLSPLLVLLQRLAEYCNDSPGPGTYYA